MSSTARRVKRPVRPVALPGGDTVHVRGLTLAELRRVDERTKSYTDAGERAVMTTVVIAAEALVEADGTRVYPDATAADLDEVAELLTPDQLDAVFLGAVGRSKADAKN